VREGATFKIDGNGDVVRFPGLTPDQIKLIQMPVAEYKAHMAAQTAPAERQTTRQRNPAARLR
jgi:hypothetical protein